MPGAIGRREWAILLGMPGWANSRERIGLLHERPFIATEFFWRLDSSKCLCLGSNVVQDGIFGRQLFVS
jgi:hypothetical protein